jgi:formyltetrahydrofolate hydrolase
MEENKYYTPELGELYFGFSFEVYNSNDRYFFEGAEGWYKASMDFGVLGNLINLQRLILDKQVRVPYLTKEDIEAEGFKKVGDQFESIKTYLGIGTGDDKKLCIYFDEEDYMVDIWYRSNRGDLYTKFEGVIKNKSEFRKILKMIGV